jgi:hypothetical protein
MTKAIEQLHDGDTVTFQAEGNIGVRFLGVDAPRSAFRSPAPGSLFVALPLLPWVWRSSSVPVSLA